MKNINTTSIKTEHVHVRTKQAAMNLLMCILDEGEALHHDPYLSERAGYCVFRVVENMEDKGTISDLGVRYELNHPSGCTTCIWWDEE